MSKYGWIIDVDHFPDEGAYAPSNANAVGMMGPRNIDAAIKSRLTSGEGRPFRMYDDDGELMYEGRFVGDDDSEDAFGPLDDFGAPNAGCTRIDYLRGTHTELVTVQDWETL